MRHLPVLALAGTLAACGSSPRTWKLVPDLRIDAGAEHLGPLTRISVSPHGVIAVEQHQDHLVVFFDARGRRLGAFGGRGDSAGEFRQITEMGWVGDTLWVDDDEIGRTTLISPDRTLVRTVPAVRVIETSRGDTVWIGGRPGDSTRLQTPWGDLAEVPARLGYLPVAIEGDGSTLDWVKPMQRLHSTAPSLGDGDGALVAVSPSGTLQDVVTSWPRGIPCRGRFAANSTRNPLCGTGWVDVSENGDRTVVFSPESFTADTARYAITVLGPRGDTIFTRHYTGRAIDWPRPPDDSSVRHSGRPAARPDGAAGDSIGSRIAEVNSVVTGRDRTIWLRMGHLDSSSPVRYLVLDSLGNESGSIAIPLTFDLMAQQRDAVWGVQTDSGWRQSVVRYRVTPAGPH